jgi:hypothetical protein
MALLASEPKARSGASHAQQKRQIARRIRQIAFTGKALRGLQTPYALAQEMGKSVGAREVLLRCLQTRHAALALGF